MTFFKRKQNMVLFMLSHFNLSTLTLFLRILVELVEVEFSRDVKSMGLSKKASADRGRKRRLPTYHWTAPFIFNSIGIVYLLRLLITFHVYSILSSELKKTIFDNYILI